MTKQELKRMELARDLVLRLVANFPGLYDGEQEVDGGDAVDWLTSEIHSLKAGDWSLEARYKIGSPPDEELA